MGDRLSAPFPLIMSEPSITGWESSQELLNTQVSQDSSHYTAVPVTYHSSLPPPSPYLLEVNSGQVHRRVNLGLRRFGNTTVNPKLPIPRATHIGTPGNVRSRHACKNCREQKAKCTGHQPCRRCYENGANCIYEVRSKDVLHQYVCVSIFHGHIVPCLLTT